jgi:DedD protein
MTTLQQQRLLGIVLLVVLITGLALFLLANVDDSTSESAIEEPIVFDSVIEPIEDMPEPEIVEPVEEVLVTIGEEKIEIAPTQPEVLFEPEVVKPSSPIEPIAPVTSSSEKEMWILQLGSFSVRENAKLLTQQLETMGYKPITEIIQSNGSPIYRVKLSPTDDKVQLESTAKKLTETLKLTPQVMRYQP